MGKVGRKRAKLQTLDGNDVLFYYRYSNATNPSSTHDVMEVVKGLQGEQDLWDGYKLYLCLFRLRPACKVC